MPEHVAVVWFRPFRMSNGATIEPHVTPRTRTIKSFLNIFSSVPGVMIMERILSQSGVKWIPNRKIPPMKYIISATGMGLAFRIAISLRAGLFRTKLQK
jgi:hypothetical protein